MQAPQAIAVASAFLTGKEVSSAKPKSGIPEFLCYERSCYWVVLFAEPVEPSAPQLGNGFGVMVNDSTCEASFQPGL